MDTPTTPAGSDASVDEPSAPVASVTPAKRVRTRKKARSAPVAPADVHIDTMRAYGLAYDGLDGLDGAVFMPPKLGKVVPGEAMDGPTAAYHVPDRATLLWLLDRGFRLADPPAPEQE